MKEHIIESYILGGFPYVWIETSEPHRAEMIVEKEIKNISTKTRPYETYHWDVVNGLKKLGTKTTSERQATGSEDTTDPMAAINKIKDLEGCAVVVAWNYHQFLKNPEVIQTLQNHLIEFKASGKTLVVLSPTTQIPLELEKMFVIIDVPLPEEDEFQNILTKISEDLNVKVPKNKMEIISSAKGLTEFEFENSLALSLAKHGTYKAEVIQEQKSQLVKKSQILMYMKLLHTDTFAYLGGLEIIKDFCVRMMKSDLYRGVLALGVPGTGKSAFSKALGNETKLPVLAMDFGKSFGSLLGESEQRIRNGLKVVDAVRKSILFIDEIEKGLSGVASSHLTDGGTGARVGSTFLTWLQERPAGQCFVIATCNDISKLPPEYLRAERWDAIFFVDLPTIVEKKIIWKIWSDFFNMKLENLPEDIGWSGAEIKTCCRLAAALDYSLKEASQYIIPISHSMGEKIDTLRSWAEKRAIPANMKSTEEEPKYKKVCLMDDYLIKEEKEKSL